MANYKPRTTYQEGMGHCAIRLMSKGASKVEVCAELKVSHKSMNTWIDPESSTYQPDFAEDVAYGVMLSQAWWEKTGRENLFSKKDFDSRLWQINMTNRFRKDWRAKHEVVIESVGSLASDILAARKRVDEE